MSTNASLNPLPHDKSGTKDEHVFYKIIDAGKKGQLKLQCINTAGIFHATVADIAADTTLLYQLHPIQSCFIGMEYAKLIKQNIQHHRAQLRQMKNTNHRLSSRYGRYRITFQNRQGNIGFIDKLSNTNCVMSARKIAQSKHLIEEFDASHAFHIGLTCELQKNKPNLRMRVSSKSYLTLVKS